MKFTFFFLFLGFFFACGNNNHYKGEDLTSGWLQNHALTYNIPVEPNTTYSLTGEIVHHSTVYNYENLYIVFEASGLSEDVRKDTLSILLADTQGFWLGQCSSEKCVHETVLMNHLMSTKKDTLDVTIRQYSREPILSGVERLNLILNKNEKS